MPLRRGAARAAQRPLGLILPLTDIDYQFNNDIMLCLCETFWCSISGSDLIIV